VSFKEENAKINQWVDFRGLTREDFQAIDHVLLTENSESCTITKAVRTRAYDWEEVLRLNPEFLEA
jgi:hypothetical protein